jgi:hypothetical protein
MNLWKKRSYDGYISTGQAACKINQEVNLAINKDPYYKTLIKRHLPQRKDIPIAELAWTWSIDLLRTVIWFSKRQGSGYIAGTN